MMRRVSAFEIVREIRQSLDTAKGKLLSGYVSFIDDTDTIKEICSEEQIEKVTIMYNNYVFSLVEVSFLEDYKRVNDLQSGKTYKFFAKDVQLERSSFAEIPA